MIKGKWKTVLPGYWHPGLQAEIVMCGWFEYQDLSNLEKKKIFAQD